MLASVHLRTFTKYFTRSSLNYITYKLAEAVLCINLGHLAATGVGLKPPKAYESWSQLEEAPRYRYILQIFNFNDTVLQEGWRK